MHSSIRLPRSTNFCLMPRCFSIRAVSALNSPPLSHDMVRMGFPSFCCISVRTTRRFAVVVFARFVVWCFTMK